MEMIKQCKGKMLEKVAISCQPREGQELYASIKYDGNYVQVHINEDSSVEFYTSGNKRFHLSQIADEFTYMAAHLPKPIVFECEYMYRSKGKLGDRVNSARLTTYRTNFAAFKQSVGTQMDTFRVFNIIAEGEYFEERLEKLRSCTDTQSVKMVRHMLMTIEDAQEWAHSLANSGWEGVMLQAPDVAYIPGKRVNTMIKLKHRPELIARVLEEEEGEGRLIGSIGSLRCATPDGVEFSVGSGLDDYMRAQWGAFVGTKIEVEYEQLSVDDIPLQPVFKRVLFREEK